jgi:hypothetical protein
MKKIQRKLGMKKKERRHSEVMCGLVWKMLAKIPEKAGTRLERAHASPINSPETVLGLSGTRRLPQEMITGTER